jgi:hypothetical protein
MSIFIANQQGVVSMLANLSVEVVGVFLVAVGRMA